ncbi:hypothetical protein RB195_003996 [Necator americanus]|uniref:non-specific serine/threonine protein kinase n=1 Tax=Necator americanus TaxID=51031 RepID=A0ABR1DRY0_NECAM
MSGSKDEIRGFSKGKVVNARWRIVGKLGEGGMGAVYKVEDKNRKKFLAAMKVEDDEIEGGVIKLEVFILQKLQPMKDTIRLYDFGKRKKYSFMVMSLLGKDLMMLKRKAGKQLSESTILRVAVSTLYAIKQVHEIGYVHRDIKPGNFLIGTVGREKRIMYLIDFGMARSFVAKDEATGKLAIRKPRDGEQLFRGTPRYCSVNTHHGKEQGRVDDLWSWFYMLIDLYIDLPWGGLSDEKVICILKEECPPKGLIRTCPEEFHKIYQYLKTLKYEDRPDYYGLFSECSAGLKRVRGSFLDRYEWEIEPCDGVDTALSASEDEMKNHKPSRRSKIAQKTYPFASTAVFKENILKL